MRTHEEDTAGTCSFASFGVSSKVLSGTSHDASEEVSIFPHLLPISDESGEARCAFCAEGVYVPTKRRGGDVSCVN